MRKTALLSLLLICCCNAFAHMLWIETAFTGTKGKQQEVKIFYGEYAENAPEKIDDWYSDVKAFTLWLTGPDGKKTKLDCTPAGNHFTAAFTPASDGIYTLSVSHDARELGGTTKYQFNAFATVKVGRAVAPAPATEAELTAHVAHGKTWKVNREVPIKSLFKNLPAEKIQIAVFSPSGWNRTVVTNAEGLASFTPLWPGRYMLEATKMNQEEGELYNNKYKGVWRNATIAFEVVD